MNRPYLRKRRIHPVDVYRDYISELDKYVDYLESQLKDHEEEKIKKHLKLQPFLLPTDEEIEAKISQLSKQSPSTAMLAFYG